MTSFGMRKMINATTIGDLFSHLAAPGEKVRQQSAQMLFNLGRALSRETIEQWAQDTDFRSLLITENDSPRATVGIAVSPGLFANIRTANGNPKLANVPPDQDAVEFELHFSRTQPTGKESPGPLRAPRYFDDAGSRRQRCNRKFSKEIWRRNSASGIRSFKRRRSYTDSRRQIRPEIHLPCNSPRSRRHASKFFS